MLHIKDYSGASCGARRLQKICQHENIYVAQITYLPLKDIPKPLGSHSLSLIYGKNCNLLLAHFGYLFFPNWLQSAKEEILEKLNEVPDYYSHISGDGPIGLGGVLLFPFCHPVFKGPHISLISTYSLWLLVLYFTVSILPVRQAFNVMECYVFVQSTQTLILAHSDFLYSFCLSHMFSLRLYFELLELWC